MKLQIKSCNNLENFEDVRILVGELGELRERVGDDAALLEVEEVVGRVYGGHVRDWFEQRRALQPALRQRLAHRRAELLVLHVPPPPRGTEAVHFHRTCDFIYMNTLKDETLLPAYY